MDRYPCKSKMSISCHVTRGSRGTTHTISIWVEHHSRHIPYYNVDLPSEAAEMIQENLEWTCPSEIAKKVQMTHLSVTASQIYRAWMTMSEILWKRDLDQLTSVRTLLGEFDDNVDILRLPAIEGAIQVAWVMKDIVGLLQGKIVEVGIDTTCKRAENQPD